MDRTELKRLVTGVRAWQLAKFTEGRERGHFVWVEVGPPKWEVVTHFWSPEYRANLPYDKPNVQRRLFSNLIGKSIDCTHVARAGIRANELELLPIFRRRLRLMPLDKYQDSRFRFQGPKELLALRARDRREGNRPLDEMDKHLRQYERRQT